MKWHTVATLMVLLASPSAVHGDQPHASLRDIILLGEQLVERTRTHPLTKPYVGNKLNCTSCHLENGRHDSAASFIGVATAYPAWSSREERVITLEDRVLNCFMRSQNGIRPPLGSTVSMAITAYITSLSTGQPIQPNGVKPLGPNHVPPLSLDDREPNVSAGADLYASQCADCHAPDGQGTDEGPPVWGNDSFNSGAGLSRNGKLASWLKVAMPPDDASLSAQEAHDIAAYINRHPRPDFQLREHLPERDRLGEYNGRLPE